MSRIEKNAEVFLKEDVIKLLDDEMEFCRNGGNFSDSERVTMVLELEGIKRYLNSITALSVISDTFIEYYMEDEYNISHYDNAADCYRWASSVYAFSDCEGGMIDIKRIVVDGREVEYAGWEPCMVYTFVDKETGRVVHSEQHLEWDH